MVKRKASDDPEFVAELERYRDTLHDSLTFEGRRYESGDSIYVQLPSRSEGIAATFLRYVTPLKGRAYVEVETRKGVNRAIRPEAIIRGGKKV